MKTKSWFLIFFLLKGKLRQFAFWTHSFLSFVSFLRYVMQTILLKYIVKQTHAKEKALEKWKILTSLNSMQNCYWANRTSNKMFFYATHRSNLRVELCAFRHLFCQGVPKRYLFATRVAVLLPMGKSVGPRWSLVSFPAQPILWLSELCDQHDSINSWSSGQPVSVWPLQPN